MLNSLSVAADVAGIPKNFFADLANNGNLPSLFFQKSKGQVKDVDLIVLIYSSISLSISSTSKLFSG